jgi:hypothetical protein
MWLQTSAAFQAVKSFFYAHAGKRDENILNMERAVKPET